MRVLVLLPLVACTSSPPDDVTGPFTGTSHRFVIDSYALPTSSATSSSFAPDLSGARRNAIGEVIYTLNSFGDVNTHADAMRGVLPTTIVIQANDLASDDNVGVSYIGHPGDTAVPVGGRIVDGVFTSNRETNTAEGAFVLPVFADADPTTFVLSHGQITLTPDTTGYTAVIGGLVAKQDALQAASASAAQMVMDDPQSYASFGIDLDVNGDGRVVASEAMASNIMTSFLSPDVDDSLSFGFGVHLVACDSGDCATPTTNTCFDRVLDGNETSVDCGGSCQPCGFDSQCKVDADCQSGACDPNGSCREPSCSDGIQNGLELGVDCGPATCGLCPGQACARDADCHGGTCDFQICVSL